MLTAWAGSKPVDQQLARVELASAFRCEKEARVSLTACSVSTFVLRVSPRWTYSHVLQLYAAYPVVLDCLFDLALSCSGHFTWLDQRLILSQAGNSDPRRISNLSRSTCRRPRAHLKKYRSPSLSKKDCLQQINSRKDQSILWPLVNRHEQPQDSHPLAFISLMLLGINTSPTQY